MKRNAFVSVVMIAIIVLTPLSRAMDSFQRAEAVETTCAVEFDQAEYTLAEQRSAALAQTAANRPVSTSPNPILTQERVLSALDAIHDYAFPTDDNLLAIEQYRALSEQTLSDTAKAVQAVLLQEIETLKIEPHELDTRDVELQTPYTHPDWDQYEFEAEQLFSSLPGRIADSQRLIFGLGLAALAAIVVCDFGMQACQRDVADALEDCLKNRICDDGECADKECCNDKAASDVLNCLLCGTNGPDDDYDNCCE